MNNGIYNKIPARLTHAPDWQVAYNTSSLLEPSDDKISGLVGTKYLCKRSKSEGDIEQQDTNSDIQDMVGKDMYGEYCTINSLVELIFYCIFSTYEYVYLCNGHLCRNRNEWF